MALAAAEIEGYLVTSPVLRFVTRTALLCPKPAQLVVSKTY